MVVGKTLSWVGCVGALFLGVPGWALTSEELVNIEVYKKASPSVVHIRSTTIRYGLFFQPVPAQGTGSGTILDKEGHIVTNAHVVERAKIVDVTLSDGSMFKGIVLKTLPEKDLALVKVDASPEKLVPISLGDSADVVVGQAVFAIGNPFGFHLTLTKGVISSLSRTVMTPRGVKLEGLIQTDAAINPGNSGGPLLDRDGFMIGINTAILSPSGANVGIGFAIPVSTLKSHLPTLMGEEKMRWPWMLLVALGAVILLWVLTRKALRRYP